MKWFQALDTLGIEITALVAGLVGSVAALSIMPPRTFGVAIATLVGGVGCAAYVTPFSIELANWYLEAELSRNVENGVAFLWGGIGMNVVAGLIGLSKQWRKNPTLDPRDIGKRDDD